MSLQASVAVAREKHQDSQIGMRLRGLPLAFLFYKCPDVIALTLRSSTRSRLRIME